MLIVALTFGNQFLLCYTALNIHLSKPLFINTSMLVAGFAAVVQFRFHGFFMGFLMAGITNSTKHQNHYQTNNYWQRPIVFFHEQCDSAQIGNTHHNFAQNKILRHSLATIPKRM